MTSCGISPIERINKSIDVKSTTTFTVSIPNSIKEQALDANLYRKTKSLDLPILLHGTNDFELRIWDDYKFPKGKLFIFKYENGKWCGRECNYKYEITKTLLPDSLSGNLTFLSEPKIGWDKFFNKLLDLGIMNLTDFESISGYDLASDEPLILLEYSNVKYYKVIELPGARQRQTRFTDAKKITEILSFIYKAFPEE